MTVAVASVKSESAGATIAMRRARLGDMEQVVALDERVTGLAKPEYWRDVFDRYAERPSQERFFLVAEADGPSDGAPILGFIAGEVRAWEFGSGPCGWVLALSVDPDERLRGIGHGLFEAMCEEFKTAGVGKMRTMVARDNRLHLSFFRGEGMMAGPYFQLEKELD